MPDTLVFLALQSVSATPYSPSVKPILLEPRQRPAAVGIEVAFLLGQRLVERLVDERQRLAHRERLALGVEHLRVAGIDRHAGADSRLRQIHRRDIAACRWASATGNSALSAVTNSRRVAVGASRRAWAADENDAGCEGVGFRCPHAAWPFGPHGPSAADGEPCADNGIKERLPAGAGGAASLSLSACLKA